MRRVMDDVRHQTAMNPSSSSSSSSSTQQQNGGGVETNGNGNGNSNKKAVNGSSSYGGVDSDDKQPNLALPQAVVEDALRVTRESLEMVCEIEGDGT